VQGAGQVQGRSNRSRNLRLRTGQIAQSKGHIFGHRWGKQLIVGILKHQPHLRAKLAGPQRLAKQTHLARAGGQQAAEGEEQGSFTRAIGADHPQMLPNLDP